MSSTGDDLANTLGGAGKSKINSSVGCWGTKRVAPVGRDGCVDACRGSVLSELLEKLLESDVGVGKEYDTDLDRPGRWVEECVASENGGEMSGVFLPKE